MNIEANIRDILALMERPSFCVRDGVILEVNQEAAALGFRPEMAIAPMLGTNQQVYAEFTEGLLHLPLTGSMWSGSARVSKLGDLHLFTLEQEEPQLQAYALAAQELRRPLQNLVAVIEHLAPELNQIGQTSAGIGVQNMNRSIYQLHRLVNNMSDAQDSGIARMELRELTSVVQEIMDRVRDLFESIQVTLDFHNHPERIFSLADVQKLERAIYNLLSNALKHTPTGGTVSVQFYRKGNHVYFTVTDPGTGGTITPEAFRKFLREPGLGDPRDGLGLGITLVRSIAAAHQGNLLFRPVSTGGMQAVLSFPIRQGSSELRAPLLTVDYAGELDHGLVELSEFLPPDLYSL